MAGTDGMRVLHVCPYMHPSAGGPPIVVDRLCLLAPSEGWDASVITTSLYCEDDGNELQKKLRERIDAKVLPIGGPRFLKQAYWAGDVIDKAVRLADIVHLHTLWHPLNAIARKACTRHCRRYVMMPHGMLDPYSLGQKRWRKKIYLAASERRTLKGANRLIFTTFHEQQAARESLSWLGRAEIVHLGSDNPPDNMPREAARQAFVNLFPQIAGRRCLLFLGRLHPKKGLERLLTILPRIIHRHPSILLIIAGDGEHSHVLYIKNLVQSINLEPYVLFTGMIDDLTKWWALASAEIFILPSKQENFGISVAEAMHSAVPVVISNKVNLWPFVERARAGFVVEEEEIELSLLERLDELLSAPGKGRCMGMRGQNFAREYFTWQRATRDMVLLYDRLMSE
jgi:glycosyltransferase involved in cell wall biosynthesis